MLLICMYYIIIILLVSYLIMSLYRGSTVQVVIKDGLTDKILVVTEAFFRETLSLPKYSSWSWIGFSSEPS
jgi:hypothetical protein